MGRSGCSDSRPAVLELAWTGKMTSGLRGTAVTAYLAVLDLLDRGMGKVPEVPPDKPAPAYASYRPLTPEQKAFAEHMVKTLPDGEKAGG